uniref:Uncharacterized protein n=1 Tax=Leptobrachium leishanense TaxID=445787 RepID=A0A8C5LT24_9ANUR
SKAAPYMHCLDAGTIQVVHCTEKFGQAEKTVDAHFENLPSRFLPQPKPRVEFLYEKLDQEYRIDAASMMGLDLPYGQTIRWENETKLGVTEQDVFMTPHCYFMEGDCRTGPKEINIRTIGFGPLARVNHLRCSHRFVEAQAMYFAQCCRYIGIFKSNLVGPGVVSPSVATMTGVTPGAASYSVRFRYMVNCTFLVFNPFLCGQFGIPLHSQYRSCRIPLYVHYIPALCLKMQIVSLTGSACRYSTWDPRLTKPRVFPVADAPHPCMSSTRFVLR